ncbi:MAG: Hsp70 family protein [Deltaproteobacteria bacterium]|nr:Hsp70 family protein [Deltaproteobacteria bacterium]
MELESRPDSRSDRMTDMTLDDVASLVKSAADERAKKELLLQFIRDLPAGAESLKARFRAFDMINGLTGPEERRNALMEFVKAVPRADDFLSLFISACETALKSIEEVKAPIHRKSALLRLSEEIPDRHELNDLYAKVMAAVIDASDKIDDRVIRKYSLVDIANRLMARRAALDGLALHSFKVALGIAEGAGYWKCTLEDIAKELPKSSDYMFYRNHTFLGIVIGLPKRGEFLNLYRDGIRMAIKASRTLEEPFYRKYALSFIADELPKTDEFLPLYRETLTEAFNAMLAMRDPFQRQYALLELLRELPKNEEFFPLVFKSIEESLSFFSVRSRMKDVEVIDVVDYILVAEERKMNDSKKSRFMRENYAKLFSLELEKFGAELNDIRLLDILRPYAHVWVRPVVLRDAVKKVMDHLTALKERYHGKEVERPVFVREEHPRLGTHAYSTGQQGGAGLLDDTLSIDLGATNTVIMRKKGDGPPEFVSPEGITRRYGDISIVPTLMDPESDSIGAEAEAFNAINIKKMLLERNPAGRELMERYFSVLYRHIKDCLPQTGWLSALSFRPTGRLCVTVPVGFHDYRKALQSIIKKVAKGMEVEFVEEPLAAAIGYQIAGERDKLVLVLDFGGCTLDIMLLRLNINETHVVAKPDRSKILGGRDIDAWLADYLAKKCGITGEDLRPRLLSRAEAVKIALSEHRIVPLEWNGREGCRVSRDDLEGVLAEHDFYSDVDRSLSYILKKGRKLGVTKDMIEAVILTGGSSQIPSFKEKIADNFPELREKNLIYDHSPLTAVARGAAMYRTKDVIDRHLGMAYALRLAVKGKVKHHSYEIVFEKGDSLPFEKTFRLIPARTLGAQDEIFLEFFEVPEGMVTRRWVRDADMEFIKQVLRQTDGDVELNGFKVVALPLGRHSALDGQLAGGDIQATFCVNEGGDLRVRYGREAKEIDTDIRLQ